MKCVKFGSLTVSTSGSTIDISDLGFTSQEDYMVLLDTGAGRIGGADSGYGNACYISAKTATSFTLMASLVSLPVSYQVISFV